MAIHSLWSLYLYESCMKCMISFDQKNFFVPDEHLMLPDFVFCICFVKNYEGSEMLPHLQSYVFYIYIWMNIADIQGTESRKDFFTDTQNQLSSQSSHKEFFKKRRADAIFQSQWQVTFQRQEWRPRGFLPLYLKKEIWPFLPNRRERK